MDSRTAFLQKRMKQRAIIGAGCFGMAYGLMILVTWQGLVRLFGIIPVIVGVLVVLKGLDVTKKL